MTVLRTCQRALPGALPGDFLQDSDVAAVSYDYAINGQ